MKIKILFLIISSFILCNKSKKEFNYIDLSVSTQSGFYNFNICNNGRTKIFYKSPHSTEKMYFDILLDKNKIDSITYIIKNNLSLFDSVVNIYDSCFSVDCESYNLIYQIYNIKYKIYIQNSCCINNTITNVNKLVFLLFNYFDQISNYINSYDYQKSESYNKKIEPPPAPSEPFKYN